MGTSGNTLHQLLQNAEPAPPTRKLHGSVRRTRITARSGPAGDCARPCVDNVGAPKPRDAGTGTWRLQSTSQTFLSSRRAVAGTHLNPFYTCTVSVLRLLVLHSTWHYFSIGRCRVESHQGTREKGVTSNGCIDHRRLTGVEFH